MRGRALSRESLREILVSLPSDRATLAAVARSALGFLSGAEQAAVAVAVSRALLKAERDGEVETRDHPVLGETIVFLTPLGAHRAFVKLSDDSETWEPVGGPDPLAFRRRARDGLTDDADVLRGVADPGPSPFDRVMALESSALDPVPPLPIYLVGLTMTVPLPKDPFPSGACPAHTGRLRTHDYCFYCDSGGSSERRPNSLRLP